MKADVSKTRLKELTKQAGPYKGAQYFFSPGAMRAFNSRLETGGWVRLASKQKPRPILFITSEAYDSEGRERFYSVRELSKVGVRTLKGGYSAPGVVELPTMADAQALVDEIIERETRAKPTKRKSSKRKSSKAKPTKRKSSKGGASSAEAALRSRLVGKYGG